MTFAKFIAEAKLAMKASKLLTACLVLLNLGALGVIVYLFLDYKKCKESCAPHTGMVIESICHCKTETGWEKK